MKIFLVRHGKTDSHLENKRQTPDTPLGELGISQAKLVAERLVDIKADILLSSNWPRAKQTAEIISKATGLDLVIYPELHEQDKPRSVVDVADDSEINKKFIEERRIAGENLDFDWKFDNEGESLNELLARSRMVANDLATKYPGEKLIAVTHGIFIAAMITSIILGADAHKKSVLDFFSSLSFHNAGISTIEYDEETGKWQLISLNDHSHIS